MSVIHFSKRTRVAYALLVRCSRTSLRNVNGTGLVHTKTIETLKSQLVYLDVTICFNDIREKNCNNELVNNERTNNEGESPAAS